MTAPLEAYEIYDLPVCGNCYSKDSIIVKDKIPPAEEKCGNCKEPAKLYVKCKRYAPPGTVDLEMVKDNPLAGTIHRDDDGVSSQVQPTEEVSDGKTTPEPT